MNKRYRLGEIEEAVSEMEELIDTQDDIAEIDDDFQIVVSGWSVYVERLNLTLRQGVACIWDTEAGFPDRGYLRMMSSIFLVKCIPTQKSACQRLR